jgi:multidrug efflux pump subunit AcrB
MLIGLITKNSILLVEFMDQLREQGEDIKDAILKATEIRLRPVMMTIISTVFGSLPLILSTGPGSEARASIGWVVFGGLGFASLFTLYLTPVAYQIFARFNQSRSENTKILEEELEKAAKQN